MSEVTHRLEIASPPPDAELGFARKPLKYLASLPRAGVGPDTGVILFICPWGIVPEDTYCRDVLLPRLADRYDCLVAAPAYFGIGLKRSADGVLEAPVALVEVIRKHLGEAVAALPFVEQLRVAAKAGMTELPKQYALSISCLPEYQSFGFLPALDCIAVLADLLGRFPVRRDRLHCLGSSYGGYVACLLLKLLPNSFHLVVENSGFTVAQPMEMANREFEAYHWDQIGGMRVPICEASPWTFRDAASPYFANPAAMALRDCTLADHFLPSKTLVRSYHSVEDALIPIDEKRKFWAALAGKASLRATEVTPDRLDGKLFKTMAHGMDASLSELMADAMIDVPFASADGSTDFERETVREFGTADRLYRVRYGLDLGIAVEIVRAL